MYWLLSKQENYILLKIGITRRSIPSVIVFLTWLVFAASASVDVGSGFELTIVPVVFLIVVAFLLKHSHIWLVALAVLTHLAPVSFKYISGLGQLTLVIYGHDMALLASSPMQRALDSQSGAAIMGLIGAWLAMLCFSTAAKGLLMSDFRVGVRIYQLALGMFNYVAYYRWRESHQTNRV